MPSRSDEIKLPEVHGITRIRDNARAALVQAIGYKF